jgi:hypothetical protein
VDGIFSSSVPRRRKKRVKQKDYIVRPTVNLTCVVEFSGNIVIWCALGASFGAFLREFCAKNEEI